MNFFLIFQAFIRGRKKVLTPSYIFHHKNINITSFSTRVYIFYLSFLHYNVKNVTYFLTIKGFFSLTTTRNDILYILEISFFLNISFVAPMNREMV